MKEAEWLASTDPRAMLEALDAPWTGPDGEVTHRRGERISARKLRLFVVACYRLEPIVGLDAETIARIRHAVDVAERFADGQATLTELIEADDACMGSACTERGIVNGALSMTVVGQVWKPDHAAQAGLLRCVVGNPFRPVQVSKNGRLRSEVIAAKSSVIGCCNGHADYLPCDCLKLSGDILPALLAWDNGIVPKLAQAIYDERAWDRLPILADALEEGGCGDDALLRHARGSGPHGRGCHVLDLILGKG